LPSTLPTSLTPPEAALAERLKRLDRVESRLAISELIHTYARCIRYDRPDEVGALFTEDGIFELREGHPDQAEFTVKFRYEGRDNVHTQMSANKGSAHPVPLIHNLIVELDGDSATANCVMNGTIFGTNQAIMGEYRDCFRREQGDWLFSERIFTMFASAFVL
jgi:hypothetical protein